MNILRWWRWTHRRCEECGRPLNLAGVCPEVARQRRDWDARFELFVRTGEAWRQPIGKRP